MANTYNWQISALDCKVSEDGMTNIVQTVHWRYSGTNDKGTFYEMFGAESVGNPNPESFTPFDELTIEIVVSWLESIMDVKSMNENIINQIELIENPIMVTLQLPNNSLTE